MRSGQQIALATSLALSVLLAAAMAPRSAAGQGEATGRNDQAPGKATCVFTHPAFSGKCTENVVVPGSSTPADACAVVLDCLNDIRCTKTYCSATTLRGGWKLESASPESAP